MRVGRKGQAGAAVLIVLIALLIILYILFLPPAERAIILGEEAPIVFDEDVPQFTLNEFAAVRPLPDELAAAGPDEVELNEFAVTEKKEWSNAHITTWEDLLFSIIMGQTLEIFPLIMHNMPLLLMGR